MKSCALSASSTTADTLGAAVQPGVRAAAVGGVLRVEVVGSAVLAAPSGQPTTSSDAEGEKQRTAAPTAPAAAGHAPASAGLPAQSLPPCATAHTGTARAAAHAAASHASAHGMAVPGAWLAAAGEEPAACQLVCHGWVTGRSPLGMSAQLGAKTVPAEVTEP